MIQIPIFKAHLCVELIPGEGVLLLSEDGVRVLHGQLYERLAPLIDGNRSSEQIVEALAGQAEPAKVYFALMLLEKNGHLAEATAEILQERSRLAPSGALETTHLDKLAGTACWVAAARAAESARADRLFDDPWAEALAGAEGKAWLERFGEARDSLAIRTRFFDDFLLAATATHQIRQVVILAAGMDTRALRLAWPAGIRIFELDQPELVGWKEQTLAACGAVIPDGRTTIGVNLNDDWETALLAAGFDPNLPSAWLLEGLLVYLPAPVVAQLLGRVTALAAPGSQLGSDVVNCGMLTSILSRRQRNTLREAGVPWRFGADHPERLLGAHGWTARPSSINAIARHYGRPALQEGLLRLLPSAPDAFLITATVAQQNL